MMHISEIEWPEDFPKYQTNGDGVSMNTFTEYMTICNQLCVDLLGIGVDDLADAEWYTYYDEGYEPREAIAYALHDYNDMPIELLEEIGLEGII